MLRRKVFRLAGQLPAFAEDERRELARRALADGATAGRRELTALAQAKLAYVEEVLDIAARFRCRAFASVVRRAAPAPPPGTLLRKDYAFLFERFFYFLENVDPHAAGIVVFDELERSESHILIQQMHHYFRFTNRGRHRAGRIVPEPFFVHSDLTTGIQIADFAAYLLSWGFRTREMTEPRRDELGTLVERLCQLRHRAMREIGDNPNFLIRSFAVITDLRAGEAGE